ncbi:MAG: elongation factor G-like protein EF-G2, partial [Actinomycetota bacterium]|nr:elongation factor G-like protein EF-G2 [Actinomycetota bacterium]
GRLSIVRVFSGRLPSDAQLHVAGHFSNRPDRHDHDLTEHDGTLSLSVGSIRRTIDSAIAGSIVTVTQLSRAETGDTISFTSNPLLVEPWLMPEANLPIAIAAAEPADERGLGTALERLIAEDPSLKVTTSQSQLTLWCLGESHADLAVERLRNRFGIEVAAQELRISLRECFSSPGSGTGLAKDEQDVALASCAIDIVPLATGAGIEIVNALSVDASQIDLFSAAERGVRQQLAQGALGGYPTTDVQVVITDVAALASSCDEHSVEMAGAYAIADAETNTGKHLLEPHETLMITVPEEFADAITNDLKVKRGTITATQVHPDGTVTLTATAPAAELFRFAIDIRSLSHGAGTFVREAAGFARVPKRAGIRMLPMAH